MIMKSRSYNNFTHWVHEYMRRPPFSGLLEDTVLLKLASPCPEAAYLHDHSWKNVDSSQFLVSRTDNIFQKVSKERDF